MAIEKRLVFANEVREIFDYEVHCGATDLFDAFDSAIENASSVDAVEVVRCKDCKHFVQSEPYDPCECMKWKVKFGVAYTEPDGYCHKAERKDND